MTVANTALAGWVDEVARLTKPERVVWLDGSEAEFHRLCAEAVAGGQLIALNPAKHPDSYLHRSNPSDTARTEHCTFVCTRARDDAGPNNNWMAPQEAYATLHRLFEGAMRGRTMYVVPYLMGPAGSPFSKVGIELTDSLYVAVNMRLMTRMGQVALDHLGTSAHFVKGLHSVGSLDPQQRYICHFPEDMAVYSINSGYGGNALLGKKCLALRLGSWLGRQEGWLAEHMLIMGVEDPQGKITYIAGAFPSACGKTNLAMLTPSRAFKGYRVWVVGDDIAWLRVGDDGRLYAVNPEAGFFGVAPGTNWQTNPVMMQTIAHNALYTNVALAPDGTVWWEGLDLPASSNGLIDWQGRPWSQANGQKAAHPNARVTVSVTQCPRLSPRWNDPAGVPISAILFGARRAALVPLVYEAFSWQHGVYAGATMGSETTAAAAGATGIVRTDPMAMLPFCGYNMGDYFTHWLAVGARLSHPPKIFRVNWFRKDVQGKFLWPGFGENMRVLAWIIGRCEDRAGAVETPIGRLPDPAALTLDGLALDADTRAALFNVDRAGWLQETASHGAFLEQFGERLPQALRDEHQALIARLS